MLKGIVIILIILWFLGYSPITGISIPNIELFTFNNHAITLWEVLILAVIVWAVGLLPYPLKVIASILLVLWVLSVLGAFAIAGLSNILVLIIIMSLIISVLYVGKKGRWHLYGGY